MTLTELAIKRPSMIVVIFSVLTVLGVFGFIQLNYDLMPKMTAPVITIQTVYPGASPSEVENSVTKVIEDAVTGLEKVSSVKGNSSEGVSFVVIEFNMDANINLALEDAQRKVNESVNKLPVTAKKPVISKIAFDEIPVLRMAVSSKMGNKEFYQFIKDKIQPRLSKIEGVGIIALVGGEEREIKINLDREKLKGYGLSLLAVTQAIRESNLDFPTGNIKTDDRQFVVRVAGKFDAVNEIRQLVVGRSKQGGDIRLADIADVTDGVKDPVNISRLNGISSIGMQIVKQSDGNTVEVSKKVRAELAKFEKEYSNIGLKFNIAQDGSTFIMDSANAVKFDLMLAVIFVALVMLVFLHNMRNSLIVMVAIPASLVSTLFLMYIFDFTLNTITLLAMSLVIGILVDDSIVVLENIYRHLELGEKKRDAALKGRNEIGFAALSITFVDVVVFLPLALIVGIVGSFLRQYALVVVFSTLMSLFVSFTVTPLLASRFSQLEHLKPGTLMGDFGLWIEKLFERISAFYQKALKWSLKHGGKVAAFTVVLLISSFSLFPLGFIGVEFVPGVDRGEIIVTVELEPGAAIEGTNDKVQTVESIIKKMPEVEKILTNVGASSEGLIGFSKNNSAELYVTLVDKHKRSKDTDDISQDIKLKVSGIPGVKARVAPVSMMGTANRSPIMILVSGTNYDQVLEGGAIVADVARQVEGTSDVRLSVEEGKPELRVDIDRKKMAQFGLSINEVGQNLRIALTGDEDSKFREGSTEYAMRIVLDRFDRYDPASLRNFSFMNNKGQQIQLQQFANVYQTTGPAKLERQDRIGAVTVQSQVFGKSSGVVASEITKKLENVKLPGDVKFEFTGEQKTMADTMRSLLYAIAAAILFVYLIMVALYDSYIYPFVVLFSIPLAIIGAFLGLALTMKTLSLYSMLGLIMLIGLVAKNAILLVDRTNQMKLEGFSTYDALIEAGKTRLRPILMTTLSMIVGMSPIALASSAGSEAKSGLAMVLIGGLSSSLVLTLVIVPIVYQRVDKWKEAVMRRRHKTVELTETE